MQWLFDLFKEWAGVPGNLPASYVDRGDHDVSDWELGDFTVDGNEHNFDMSSIVPAEVKGVNLHVVATSSTITDIYYLRPKSHPHIFGSCTIRPQVADHTYCVRRAFGCDADRIFTYKFTGAGWTYFKINVKGWWF